MTARAAAAWLALALLLGCEAPAARPPPASTTAATTPPAATTEAVATATATALETPTTPPDPVAELLARLTTEQRVGQLFVAFVHGDSATQPAAEARRRNVDLYGVETAAEVVARFHLGGIAYLGRGGLGGATAGNLENPAQIATLSQELHAAAFADSGAGLLIGVDQEGGRVVRVGPPATVFPSAAQLGAIGDADLAGQAATVTGAELRALGITQVFAPVADVNVNPANAVIGDRSFGADSTTVAAFVAAQVTGFGVSTVAATVKHFPGHGDTSVDSHEALPTVVHDRPTWEQLDLPPFAAGIAAGVPAVMVGHLAVPALDPSGTPATLSAPIIGGVLRDHLGFDGVVLTDALNMGGITTSGSQADIAVSALEAGIDVLLMPADLPAAYDAVVAAVNDGRISAARLEASVRRVLDLKAALGLLAPVAVDPATAPAALGAPAALALREEIARRCGC